MNLVVHHGALGDFVLLFPLLRVMTSPTLIVGHDSKAKLAARLFPHVTAVSIERPDFARLFQRGAPADSLPAELHSANHLFSFVSDGRDAWAENARAVVGEEAQIYFLQPRPPAEWRHHVCGWHAQQLFDKGWSGDLVFRAAFAQRLSPSPYPWVRSARPSPVVVIHPGSGGREKCWPVERFEALIQRMRQGGYEVRTLLGEVERERWPGDVQARWAREFNARFVDSLDTLCDALLDADLYIGNDSGPTHLAAQLGEPTVALFGPSNGVHWSPCGPKVAVIAPPKPVSMEWLDVERVWGECQRMLAADEPAPSLRPDR